MVIRQDFSIKNFFLFKHDKQVPGGRTTFESMKNIDQRLTSLESNDKRLCWNTDKGGLKDIGHMAYGPSLKTYCATL